jgi:tRNA (guanosine-2'-O-)-methyltransferase
MDFSPELLEYLAGFVTPARLERMRQVLAWRSRYLTVVLEDIYQPHNASAVLRTCDAFGIQDVHIIEKRNEYRVNPDVALGSAQWLTLHHYRKERSDSLSVIQGLKAQGYKVIATAPHATGCSLYDYPLAEGRTALLFGTELTGISPEAMAAADGYVAIPMYGFVESFNISVSVAICLSELSTRMRQEQLPWRLDQTEQDLILWKWLQGSVKHSEKILEDYRNKNKS